MENEARTVSTHKDRKYPGMEIMQEYLLRCIALFVFSVEEDRRQ